MPTDPTPVENIQMLSVIAHVLGFDLQDAGQPPLPAENARDAELLMFNWIASNSTDEDIVWHFPTAQRYDLVLLQMTATGWDLIWRREPEVGEGITVTIPRGKNFGIPPTVDDGNDDLADDGVVEEQPPTIPLKQIVDDHHIAPTVELAVRFRLKATEFPQEMLIPLWR